GVRADAPASSGLPIRVRLAKSPLGCLRHPIRSDAGTTPPALRALRCDRRFPAGRPAGRGVGPTRPPLPEFPSVSTKPKLRSFPDRLRQIAMFEIGGLVLITPPFAWASGVPIRDSIGLLALLALMAAIWNGAYNTAFDW